MIELTMHCLSCSDNALTCICSRVCICLCICVYYRLISNKDTEKEEVIRVDNVSRAARLAARQERIQQTEHSSVSGSKKRNRVSKKEVIPIKFSRDKVIPELSPSKPKIEHQRRANMIRIAEFLNHIETQQAKGREEKERDSASECTGEREREIER